MYATDPSAVHFVPILKVPLRLAVLRWKLLLGNTPLTLSAPSERRPYALSVPPLTPTVVAAVTPVAKKSLTLSGCAIHGVGVQLLVPAPGLVNWQISRPSSLGPQLSSTPSFTPP